MSKKIAAIIILFLSGIGFASKPILNIKHWKTSQAVPVYFVHSSSAPMLQITLLFKVGSYYDGKELGLATLTSSLLSEGTQQLSAKDLSDALSRLGANVEINNDKENTAITLKCLTQKKYFNKSIELFKQLLTQPAFRPNAIQRVKAQMLSSLKIQQQDPKSFAQQALLKLIYKDTPLAHNVLGTPQTLANISQQDIQKFYQHYLVKRNLALFLIGDVSQQQAKIVAGQLIHHLTLGKTAPAIKAVHNPNQSIVKSIHFPSNQTYILSATLVHVDKQNRFPLIVGNYIFGGNGLTSILGDVLRQKYSISYSATSQLMPGRNQHLWMMSLQAKNAQAMLARKLSLQALLNYQKQGPNAQQLAAAKSFLSNSLPLRFTNNEQINTAMINLYLQHLPLNFYDSFSQNIEASNKASIMKAIQHNLQTQHMVTVIVGGKHV